MANLHVDAREAREVQEQIKFFGLRWRTICHVIYYDIQFFVLFQKRH